MRRTFRALAYVLAVSAGMTAASAVPSFAQTTTTTTAPAVKHVRKHHVLHPGIGSASSRNVGPTSSTTGSGAVAGSSAASGTPSVAGAPAAGNSGTGGK
jgi:hypothetical protein